MALDLYMIVELQMIPVAANDVAFSAHAVILTAFTLFQIAIYDVISSCHCLYILLA